MNELHGDLFTSVIAEADSQQILRVANTYDEAKSENGNMFLEAFDVDELMSHYGYAYCFKCHFKYLNIARVLNLKWITPIYEVIRTPNEIIISTPKYQTNLRDYMENNSNTLDCARAIYKLTNAVLSLHNYGIIHRNLKPS